MARISQREARRLRLRVKELERVIEHQRRRYGQEWPGGIEIGSLVTENETAAIVRTARRLQHGVVVVGDETAKLRFIALPLPMERS